jgi:hypothetical protein
MTTAPWITPSPQPFYELLMREALIFSDFTPTAPRPSRK